MIRKTAIVLAILILLPLAGRAGMLLIPMDETQTDHLKAYGAVFTCLTDDQQAEWLLNYRAGSFLIKDTNPNRDLCLLRGVSYLSVNNSEIADIYRIIEVENMERVPLEKAPAIAVYSPSTLQPSRSWGRT